MFLVPAAITHLNVSVAERCDVSGVSLSVRPRVHYCRSAAEDRILASALRTLLPLAPQPVNVRVMHPEDRVSRRGRNRAHWAAHPDMDADVYALQLRGKVGEVRLRQGAWSIRGYGRRTR